jgi:hypothetical protein
MISLAKVREEAVMDRRELKEAGIALLFLLGFLGIVILLFCWY